MATGFPGRFVISWNQTEIDGLAHQPPGAIGVGSCWRWGGQAICVDDRRDVLLLQGAQGAADIRARAASQIRRFLGEPPMPASQPDQDDSDTPLFSSGFELTDGLKKYQANLIDGGNGAHPMLLFIGDLPPVDQDLWVISCTMPGRTDPGEAETGGTVCFAPGTRITTPNGPRLVEDLAEDDQICTKDNGVQTIRWIGSRHVSGGRLIAMPHLRPIRIMASVFADGEPDQDLIVSPDHRILIKGAVAQTLFNTPEVLVTASDLINDRTIRVDRRCRGVSYIHLMLDQHQIVWANGVEVESFHPATMAASQINPHQRQTLWDRFPDIRDDVFSYGEFARRNLSRPEAAVLSYGAFGGH